jgi:hypothetical protein
VESGGTDILTAGTLDEATPSVARRTWPRWLLLGAAMIVVAVLAVVWHASGARLLLGAGGLFLAARGVVLVRGSRFVDLDSTVTSRARSMGSAVAVVGVAAVAAALLFPVLTARVLLVVVPAALVAGAVALLARAGIARRAGQALLVWSVLVTGLLVATGLARGWDRASDVATVVAAVAVAVLAVPLLMGAARLRAVASRPDPEPVRPAACAGCACGAGGCGAFG